MSQDSGACGPVFRFPSKVGFRVPNIQMLTACVRLVPDDPFKLRFPMLPIRRPEGASGLDGRSEGKL